MNNVLCYDPLKQLTGTFFSKTTWLRRILYRILDAIILRSWHLHREIAIWAKGNKGSLHILDAGCGFGQYSYFLHKINPEYNILGVDQRCNQVCRCNDFIRKRELTKLHFKTENLTDFVYHSAFDLILCVDVMQYIENDQKVFENFFYNLTDNGILLLSAPTSEGTTNKPVYKSDDLPLFRVGYAVNELKARLKEIGFKKVRTRYTYGKPGQFSWILSIKIPTMLLSWSKIFIYILPLYYFIIFPICVLLNFIDTRMGHLNGKAFILKAYK